MQWFHVKDGQRYGPHSEAEFNDLIKSGQIAVETLVWRDGMPGWQPYGVMVSGPPPVQPPQTYGPWRSRKVLVMVPGIPLPNRCVKCNAPTDKKLKRNLQWHNPLLYFLICAGLLVYIIVMLILRKTAQIEIGLCDAHFKRRRVAIAICWLAFLGGIGGIAAGIAWSKGWPALAGAVAILASLVYASVGVSPVSPKKIDDNVWLNGCGKEFLAEFPEWPYPSN